MKRKISNESVCQYQSCESTQSNLIVLNTENQSSHDFIKYFDLGHIDQTLNDELSDFLENFEYRSMYLL